MFLYNPGNINANALYTASGLVDVHLAPPPTGSQVLMAEASSPTYADWELIKDANVDSSAAIAKSKLASLDIVDADVDAAAAIAKSKLASLDIVDADVDAAAAIAASKLSGVSTPTSSDSFTNKTITDSTNTVTANNLRSATTVVNVDAATAPSLNQVLTATDSTHATWQTPAGGAGPLILHTIPQFNSSSGGTTYAFDIDVQSAGTYYESDGPRADGDKYKFFFNAAGTETKLFINYLKSSNMGKFDVYVNGTLDSSGYDTYNATPTAGQSIITLSQSITAGANTIELRVNGKNGSSAGYWLSLMDAGIF